MGARMGRMKLSAETGGFPQQSADEISATVLKKPVSVDVEWLLQWAVGQTGNLPWSRDRDCELAFDRGLTVKPRKREHGSWAIAEACAGLRFGGTRPLPARMHPTGDAEKILAEIMKLDGRTASTIIACARSKIRPDWMPGVEAKMTVVGSRRCKKRHKRIPVMDWRPCRPEAIRAAREVYTRWHAALIAMMGNLDGRLSGFRINGLSAPANPWQIPAKSAA